MEEMKLMEIHCKEGKRRFGKKWNNANIGWGIDEDSIETKVYGHPTKVFVTNYVKGRIEHVTTLY